MNWPFRINYGRRIANLKITDPLRKGKPPTYDAHDRRILRSYRPVSQHLLLVRRLLTAYFPIAIADSTQGLVLSGSGGHMALDGQIRQKLAYLSLSHVPGMLFLVNELSRPIHIGEFGACTVVPDTTFFAQFIQQFDMAPFCFPQV
jgi:hypothetical protein